MLTAHRTRLRQRRGVALILILGMLGLLALIGVTFATFTGQARVGARNYAQSVLRPQTGELMDYALSQLIGDTSDIRSAIRGHSMARDMYGNDAASNGYVDQNPANTVDGTLQFTAAAVVTSGTWQGAIRAETNIPVGHPAFYGYDFKRWVVKFDAHPGTVAGGVETRLIGQTFEVIGDDVSGAVGDPRVFYLTPPASTSPMGARNYGTNVSPDVHPTLVGTATSVGGSVLIGEALVQRVPLNTSFVLDGRFLRAFNGPGMGYIAATQAVGPGNYAHVANMRYNGGLLTGAGGIAPGDPNTVGMDEDYDAADVENWFLAIQSADGKVIIPSFHRPGILDYVDDVNNDWVRKTAVSRSKILRPRRIDGHSSQSFPDLRPSASDGRIEYDVDNDGDGLTDSVWVDLGYPAIKDSRGLMYKPLFAFMVIGLNGRIPLNTAGNLQMRGPGGNSLRNMHTARLGVSPSEVDPTFALQNAPPVYDPTTGAILSTYPQYDNAGATAEGDAPVGVNVTQLRNLLAGTRPYDSSGSYGDTNQLVDQLSKTVTGYVLPNNLPDAGDIDTTQPLPSRAVAGRWGEPGLIPSIFASSLAFMDYPNPVRAGNSSPFYPSPGADGRDGNNTAFDYWPSPTAGESPTAAWPADYYDAAGDFALAAERTRRGVTPFDLYGDGRVSQYAQPGQPDTNGQPGTDTFGRVAFDKYFRPPGIPVPTETLPPSVPVVTKGEFPPPPATVSDITNNPLHGFESYRNPVIGNGARGALRYGATPTDLDASGSPVMDPVDPTVRIVTSGGNTIPTYDNVINSLRMGRGISGADQMSLYRPNSADEPFGYQDLEWLYRSHDREGPSLHSRLADLAPVSFRDSVDAQRRRRLFSIDAWESNAIVWANDNPADATYTTGRFQDNARFTPGENASLATLQNNHGVPYIAVPGKQRTDGGVGIEGQSTAPALAHRDRKINLNYPLPVSNSPDEPTRRKWITESYQLLKTMLPPLSIEQPEELAMLSQFLVNIIDFRDHDATMTRFINPDVVIRPVAGGAPVLAFAPAQAGDLPLVQFGMEYNPIAINEVLAYCFQSKQMGGAGAPVSRFFIELVNTLTEARGGTASTLNLGGFDYTANNPYINGCWDLIFADDLPDTRPDPFTGQLLPATAATGRYAPIPLNRDSFVENRDVSLRPLEKDGVPATGGGTNYCFVIGNSLPVATAERNSPALNYPDANNPSQSITIKPEYDPMVQAGAAAAPPAIPFPPGVLPPVTGQPTAQYPGRIPALTPVGTTAYKWVCLRRPANPFAPVSATNPMVVVDSMRFHFIEGTGKTMITDPTDGPVPDTNDANRIYSTQRFQPYRGGHAVLNPLTTKLDPHYGYTEQLSVTNVNSLSTQGVYLESSAGGTAAPHFATNLIYSSLGKIANDLTERDDNWDYFVFNDRDFVSPAELLLVPGCPPGLFTKQFVEFAPSAGNMAKFSATAPTTAPPPVMATPSFGARFGLDPRSYPYLVDRLFYTSASPGLNSATTWDAVRGPSAGGWYKMFEAFEVPSRAAGAVASAASGSNYDWFRQDVRPGQLNLNLIIDEEVFLGLMGNAGLRTEAPGGGIQQVNNVPAALNGTPLPFLTPDVNGNHVGGSPIPSADPWGFNAQRNFTPLVVTEWDSSDATFGAFGSPSPLPDAASPTQRAAYPPSNVGFYRDPAGDGSGLSTLKPAFSDFLKIRHGGTGYMFGPLPEAPFRSLSHPDINYTIMRPAFATASVDTTNAVVANRRYYVPDDHGRVNAAGTGSMDAGVKNPNLVRKFDDPAFAAYYPPAVPPRRLFQLPDNVNTSNASNQGEPNQLGYTPAANSALQRSRGNLTDPTNGELRTTAQHPYWRSEWMQKMMNLSTVRTHQYAVWVTVGFFEVISQGDPAAAGSTNPDAAFDVIGREVGLIGGKNVRRRGFFIVDRLKLGGFDPMSPGKFRDAVLYRRMIQ